MRVENRVRIGLIVLLSLFACTYARAAAITLRMDATEAPRKIYHAELTIPARPGPLTLVYPKWIPGEHGPTGPITDLAGLKISASGRTVGWKRDSLDLFAFHMTVPAGSSSVDVKLDFLLTAEASGFSSGASATSELAFLSWNQVLLYPEGQASDDVQVAAHLMLPPGWQFGTALPVEKVDGNNVDFKTVSMTTLVDSPVLAGRHFRHIELSPGATPAHYLEVAADSDEALAVPPELIAKYRRLVKEAHAVFGATHYREYHFLLALSDRIAHFGLEHHESSGDQARERYLVDSSTRVFGASLLPHELVHSWNGKYRRPAGLVTRNFQQPMKGDLLWVYEGLTDYLAWVLTARSGLLTPEQDLQVLAAAAAVLDNRAGREWRSLADTAVSAQLLYDARGDWESERRGTDFYDEGMLVWLEVDTIIRKQSQHRKSIEDFCRAFYGPPSGPPQVKPYTLEDLEQALNKVVSYDWKNFFEMRLNETGTIRAPLGGIEAGGYQLAYSPEASAIQGRSSQSVSLAGVVFSIGLQLNNDGSIIDVLPEKAAAQAGIGPGMKITFVNGRVYSPRALRDALQATSNGEPLQLTVANGKASSTYTLDYYDGAKYPFLERNGQPPLLDQILKPLIE